MEWIPPLKLDAHGQQVLCYFVFSGLWLVEKNNKEKIWCRKQTQTLFYSPILVHLFSVSNINVFKSRVHAISSVLTHTTNMCQNNFVLAPNYATLVSDRSLPVAILVWITRCIGNDVIDCVAAARPLLCLKTFKWLARTPRAWKTSVLTFYLSPCALGLKRSVHASNLYSYIYAQQYWKWNSSVHASVMGRRER